MKIHYTTTMAVSILVGCGFVDTHTVPLRAPAPSTAINAELYFGEERPARPFEELALVQVIGYGTQNDPEHIAAEVIERGRELGCDAVIRLHIDEGEGRSHAYGVCVRYTDAVGGSPAPKLSDTALP